jgi:hypothetical protein
MLHNFEAIFKIAGHGALAQNSSLFIISNADIPGQEFFLI